MEEGWVFLNWLKGFFDFSEIFNCKLKQKAQTPAGGSGLRRPRRQSRSTKAPRNAKPGAEINSGV
jgi:hypothetical protein